MDRGFSIKTLSTSINRRRDIKPNGRCTVPCTHFNCSFLSPLVTSPDDLYTQRPCFISSSLIHHKSKLTSLLLMHPYLIVCFYQVFIFKPWDNRLTAHHTYQTWRCTGMCKQFFDMYLLLLFARLYYSKSHTLPQETYMSSYFVTLDMHTGHVHLFPKIRSLSLLKNDNTRKRTKRQHYIVKQRLKIPSCNQKLYV